MLDPALPHPIVSTESCSRRSFPLIQSASRVRSSPKLLPLSSHLLPVVFSTSESSGVRSRLAIAEADHLSLTRYMNALAFSGASGETVLFFLSQSLLTVSYSYIARNYSALPRNCPRWLGVVIVNFFAFLTAPLFCVPFLRCGFFEDLKAFGLLGPVKEFIVSSAWVVSSDHG